MFGKDHDDLCIQHILSITLSNCGVLALKYLAKSARNCSCRLAFCRVTAPALEKGSLYGFSCWHRGGLRNSKESQRARDWIATNAVAKKTCKEFDSSQHLEQCRDCLDPLTIFIVWQSSVLGSWLFLSSNEMTAAVVEL